MGVKWPFAALALIPSAWLAWSARDLPHLGYFHDDALYYTSARSLAAGDGYRVASLPGAPPQTKYPPLYSLALASGLRLHLPLIAVAWLALPICLALAWTASAELGVDGRVAVFLAVNPFFALSGVSLLSEAPFTCLLLASLVAAMRGRPVLAGCAAGLACLARSTGVVLLAAVPAAFLLRRRYRDAGLFLAVAAPPEVAWAAWAHVNRNATAPAYYTDYLGFYLGDVAFADLPLLVWTNLDSLVTGIGGMFVFGLGDSFAGKTAARVIAVAALAGAVRIAVRRGVTAFHLFTAGYFALLLVWNYQPDQRFVLPVFALLLAGLWCELSRMVAVGRGRSRIVVAAALIALGALAVQMNVRALTVALPSFLERHRTALKATRPAYEWIAANLPPDATLLAYNDPLVYLYTGRRACRFVIPPMLLYRHDTARLEALYHRLPGGLTHVLLTPRDFNLELGEGERATALKIFGADPRLKLLWKSEAASIYSIAR